MKMESCLLESLVLTQYSITNGQLEKTNTVVTGRKFPLVKLRKKLLANHERYMRLHTDDEVDVMTLDDLRHMMSKWSEDSPDDIGELRERFKEPNVLAPWHSGMTMQHYWA